MDVLTGLPHFPEGVLHREYRFRPIMEESRLGARVVRTFEWPYRGESLLGRATNYLSFAASAQLAVGRLARPDVIYAYHPPISVSLPACALAAQFRRPFIYDVQDLWPQAGIAAGVLRPGLVYRALEAWASKVYARAAHITVIADDFREQLINRGVPAHKISVVPNGADETLYRPLNGREVRAQYGWRSNEFIVMYAGNFGAIHGVEVILEAARRCQHLPIKFVFVGTGPQAPRLKTLAAEMQLANVSFLGYRPSQEMPFLFAAADLMLVHVRDGPHGAVSLPSRIAAYMASGRPTLVAARGAARNLIEASRGGVSCDPDDPALLVSEILALAAAPVRRDAMSDCALKFYAAHLSARRVIPSLIELIGRVAHTNN